MTQTEQVAVGHELLPCPFCGDEDTTIIVTPVAGVKQFKGSCIACDAEGPYKYSEAEAITAWNTRVASTRPISNEEVRRLVERLRSATSELMYDDLAAVEQTCTALQHLSAESQGLRSALEAADRAIQHNHEQYQHLSAREAEAREIIAAIADENTTLNRVNEAINQAERWLKAGEAEHE